MTDNPWRTFRHKEDHTCLFEVRESDSEAYYEIRLPGTTPTDYLSKEEFDKTYEPGPEE